MEHLTGLSQGLSPRGSMHARKGVLIYFFKVVLRYLIMKSTKNTSKRVKNKVVTSTGGNITVIVHCNFDELVNTNRLRPNPANPNIHSASQLNKLAKIIAAHGVCQSPLQRIFICFKSSHHCLIVHRP
ncbi:hypothetical protein ES703_45513 [subsurface metagenome]